MSELQTPINLIDPTKTVKTNNSSYIYLGIILVVLVVGYLWYKNKNKETND